MEEMILFKSTFFFIFYNYILKYKLYKPMMAEL